MLQANIELRCNAREFRSLGEWERHLSIPARTLLHHGLQGEFKLFIRRPLLAVDYYVVRDDLFGPTDQMSDRVISSSSFRESIQKLPLDEIIGFIPDRDTLANLASQSHVEVNSFDSVICRNLTWDKFRGLVPSSAGHTLSPAGWRIAAYARKTICENLNEVGSDAAMASIEEKIPNPIPIKILPNYISIRDTDIQAFISRINSHEFISDLYSDGKITEELPTYISGKLSEIIAANRYFWRNRQRIDKNEENRRRQQTIEYLNKPKELRPSDSESPSEKRFYELCNKQSNPKSLTEFAARICDPSQSPSSKQSKSSVTPTILALLSAAKLYWSSPNINYLVHETHPKVLDVASFLRHMGVNETNAAGKGVAVIRPEDARLHASKKTTPEK